MRVRHFVSVVIITIGGIMVTMGASSTDEGREIHCATFLEAIGPGEGKNEVETRRVELGCFATVSEAIAAGTQGDVLLPSDIAANEVTQSLLDTYGSGAE
jgi:hypothetical protein